MVLILLFLKVVKALNIQFQVEIQYSEKPFV